MYKNSAGHSGFGLLLTVHQAAIRWSEEVLKAQSEVCVCVGGTPT